jgi:hypothetical protein
MPKSTQPRKNSSKAEIAAQIKHTQKIARQRELARKVFAHFDGLKTIYDAQTICNAISGFIQFDFVERETKIKLSDIVFDNSKTKDQEMVAVLDGIVAELADEPAKEVDELLQMMSSKLPQFLALKHLKDPMSSLTADEFIA